MSLFRDFLKGIQIDHEESENHSHETLESILKAPGHKVKIK